MKAMRYANNHLFIVVIFVSFIFQLIDGSVYWMNHRPKTCVNDEGYQRNASSGVIKMLVSLYLLSLDDVNEHKMEFGLQLILIETWEDSELHLNIAKIEAPEAIPNYVTRCMWTPDTVFENIKHIELYKTLYPSVTIKVLPGPKICRLSRYRLIVNCPMNFKVYPMDVQICNFMISMMSSTRNEVDLQWNGTEAVRCRSSFGSTKFEIGKPRTITKIRKNPIYGNITILKVEFEFTRRVASSLVNTYIPSFLIVTLSWVSFWLDPDAVPGRVTLGVTALLTLATQIVHSRSSLPALDYMTAMDVWLFACLLMVFLSLIEFTIANMADRKMNSIKTNFEENVGPSRQSQRISWTASGVKAAPSVSWNLNFDKGDDNSTHDSLQSFRKRMRRRFTNKMNWMSRIKNVCFREATTSKDNIFDRTARILFPLVMLVFSALYWTYLI